MAKRCYTRKRVRKNKVSKYKSSGVKTGGFIKNNIANPSTPVEGGFYPSVMGGIGNVAYLTPLAIRQGIKLFRNSKRKTRKQRKSK
jgi:hypothetical protein